MLAGKIRYNILSGRDSIVGDVGWACTGDPITDRDLSYLKLYLEQHYHLNNEKHLKDAIRIVAGENRFHPIREYLERLEWDGQERIAHALTRFLGANDTSYGVFLPNKECS